MFIKKYRILDILFVYLIAVLLHFGYDFVSNNFTACFLPVNESVWEHLKMTFNAFIIFWIIKYFILKKKKEKVNNFTFNVLTSAIATILMTLVLFYPLFYTLGENVLITQIVYIISIAFGIYISSLVIKETDNDKNLNILSFLIILFFEFGFVYLTFNPRKDEIFIDKYGNKLGLNSYYLETK